jgi:hypothetical protein
MKRTHEFVAQKTPVNIGVKMHFAYKASVSVFNNATRVLVCTAHGVATTIYCVVIVFFGG